MSCARRKRKTHTLCRRVGLDFGRGERIRTSGLYVPNVALYQAKLHPDKLGNSRLTHLTRSGIIAKKQPDEKRYDPTLPSSFFSCSAKASFSFLASCIFSETL